MSNLKKLACASKQNMLELETLWYMVGLICLPDSIYIIHISQSFSFKIMAGALIKKQHIRILAQKGHNLIMYLVLSTNQANMASVECR